MVIVKQNDKCSAIFTVLKNVLLLVYKLSELKSLIFLENRRRAWYIIKYVFIVQNTKRYGIFLSLHNEMEGIGHTMKKLIESKWLIITAIIFLVTVTYCAVLCNKTTLSQPCNSQASTPIGEIYGNNTVTQSFVANHDGLSGFNVLFATYARNNNCDLTIELHDMTNNSINFNKEIPANEILDNQYANVSFEPIQNSQGHEYIISFYSTNATAGNAVTIWASNHNSFLQGDLSVAGIKVEQDLAFGISYSNYLKCAKSSFIIMFLLGIIGIAVIFITRFVAVNNKDAKINTFHISIVGSVISSCFLAISMCGLFNITIAKLPDVMEIFTFSSVFRILIYMFIIILWNILFPLNMFLPNKYTEICNSIHTKCKFLFYGVLTFVFCFCFGGCIKYNIIQGAEKYTLEILPFITAIVIMTILLIIGHKNNIWNKAKEKIKKRINATVKLKELKYWLYIADVVYLLSIPVYFAFVVTSIWFFPKVSSILFFVFTSIFFTLFLFDRLFIWRYKKAAKMFLCVFLILCGVFCYTLPASFISWDEEIHFRRTVQTALEVIPTSKLSNDEAYKENLLYQVFNNCNSQPRAGRQTSITASYHLLGYAPAIFCTILYKIFHIDFTAYIFFSRFSIGLLYSLVLYCGIKKLKSGQLLCACISMLPTCVFLASVYSYDPWVTAFITYSVCSFIGIMQSPEKQITYPDMARIFIGLIMGCGPKAVYCMIGLMFLFVKKDKFADNKHKKVYYIVGSISIILIILSFMTPFLSASGGNATDIRGGADVNSGEQLKFILSNPFQYARILLNFLLNSYITIGNMVNWCCSYAYISNNGTALGSSIAIIILFFSMFCDKNKRDVFKGYKMTKTFSLIGVFCCLCLIATALYISFTPVASGTINGVSWRYIIPLLFPALYALGNSKMQNYLKQNIVIAVSLGGMSLAILTSYFVTYISKI